MAHDVISPGEGSMCTWKKGEIDCFGVKCPAAAAAAAAAKSLQSCLTLCDPVDGSPPGSAIPGILQARTLEWVVISFSNAWKWKVKVESLSRVWLLAIPWTAAYQAPISISLTGPLYHLKLCFLANFLFSWSIHRCEWGIKVSHYWERRMN